MSNFKNILKKTIDSKSANTPSMRQAVYQQARNNLLNILEKQDSTDKAKEQKLQMLEQDILSLENDYITQQKASKLQLSSLKKRSSLKDIIELQQKQQIENRISAKSSEKISKFFVQARNKELRTKTKQNLLSLALGSIFIAIFIFSCLGIAWKFFSTHNRNIFKPDIINTNLDTGISTEKFDGRLINNPKNKHNAPTMVEVKPSLDSAAKSNYDSATYIGSNKALKPANISWSSINIQGKINDISGQIDVIDSATKLKFILEHDKSGGYAAELVYNDENYNIQDLDPKATTLNIMKNGQNLALDNANMSNPEPHKFIFNISNDNLKKIKEADAIWVNFTYKDKKTVSFSFTKNKNGGSLFDKFN